MSVEQAVTYVFTWHAQAGACPKCSLLNGRTWEHQTPFQPVLKDLAWGPVWNLIDDRSLAHGGTSRGCRCTLEMKVTVDLDVLPEYSVMVEEAENW